MKLPNDLIKATDYSKAKDREIHEFEYRNGKYIHKYVLGGEHELTPQEVVDCLNGLATIDCDLQTAYAFIQSQKDKLADLEANFAESENQLQDMERSKLAWENKYFKLEKQLAEKEKEIVALKEENERNKTEAESQHKSFIDCFKDKMGLTLHYDNLEKQHNQDKISFCIDKLEKVKEELEFNSNNNEWITARDDRLLNGICDFIDNQIKQLKEGK